MVKLFKCKGISFTNGRNKKGPRIDPCSTLAWQVSTEMVYVLVSQTVVTLLRYNWNQATLSGLVPYVDNFFNNRLWLSTSKALWKSTNASPMSSSLSILNKILSVILISTVSVELPEWKADCNNNNHYCFLEDILKETLLHVVEDFR